jgi:hypothetical protein
MVKASEGRRFVLSFLMVCLMGFDWELYCLMGKEILHETVPVYLYHFLRQNDSQVLSAALSNDELRHTQLQLPSAVNHNPLISIILSEARKARAAWRENDPRGSELDVVGARKTPLGRLRATLDDTHRVCLCISLVSDKR